MISAEVRESFKVTVVELVKNGEVCAWIDKQDRQIKFAMSGAEFIPDDCDFLESEALELMMDREI